MENKENAKSTDRMISFGAMATSLIGIFLGMSFVILGSFITWQSDEVLGIYTRSGWVFDNVINGDGKIGFAVGVVAIVLFAVGWLFKNRASYAAVAVISLFCLVFSIYEFIIINNRSSLFGTGTGVFLLGLGGVVGLFSSICGFFIVKGDYTGPQMNMP